MNTTETCKKCGHLMVDHLPHRKELLCPEFIIPLGVIWGDNYRDARAAGMDGASACHAADIAVP